MGHIEEPYGVSSEWVHSCGASCMALVGEPPKTKWTPSPGHGACVGLFAGVGLLELGALFEASTHIPDGGVPLMSTHRPIYLFSGPSVF